MRGKDQEKRGRENADGGQRVEELKAKHESDLTKKERRLLEREKLKGMGLKKKLEYIWMYYKPAIFGVIAAIAAVFLIRDLYQNAQLETVLSISVVNSGDFDSQELGAQLKEELGFDGENERVEVAANLITDSDGTSFDYYTQMAFITQLQAKTMDVLVMPQSLCEALNEEGYFAQLEELLGEETYASFGEAGHSTYLVLEGSELTETFDVEYEPVCVAVVVNSEHVENSARWVASLAPEE